MKRMHHESSWWRQRFLILNVRNKKVILYENSQFVLGKNLRYVKIYAIDLRFIEVKEYQYKSPIQRTLFYPNYCPKFFLCPKFRASEIFQALILF